MDINLDPSVFYFILNRAQFVIYSKNTLFVEIFADKFSRTSSARKFEIFRANLFSWTFRYTSKFGTIFCAILRKSLARTTFFYSFFQDIKFDNFRAYKF